MKTKIFILIATLVLFAFGINILFSKLVYSTTNSLEHRLFYKTDKPLTEGTFIFFKFKGDRYYPANTFFIKEIGCTSGNFLDFHDYSWYCGNKILKNGNYTKVTDSNGEQLRLFHFNGIIPNDKYFVLGHAPNSYDSKYWGFVDKADVITTLNPIW